MFNNLIFIILNITSILLISIDIKIACYKNKNRIQWLAFLVITLVFIYCSGVLMQVYSKMILGHTLMGLLYYYSFGLHFASAFIFIFIILFINPEVKLNLKFLLLFIMPSIFYVLVLTNNYHHFLYIRYAIDNSVIFGKYMFISVVYVSILYIIMFYLLVYHSINNFSLVFKQSLIMLFSLSISFLLNLLIAFKIIDLPLFANAASVGFAPLIIYYGIIKYQFLEINPISQKILMNSISDSFVVIDKNFNIIGYNKAFENQFKDLELMKDNSFVNKLNDANFNNSLLIAIKDKKSQQLKIEIKSTSSDQLSIFIVEIIPIMPNHSLILGLVVVFKDITELSQIQNQLIFKERFASLGILIGGIAHNMKSPLMAISANIDTLNSLVNEYEESISDTSITIEDHHEIAGEMRSRLDKTYKAIEFVNKILNSIRGQVLLNSNEKFGIGEVIDQVHVFMNGELSNNNCILNTYNSVDNVKLIGSISSLVQVLNNIVINAIHAYDGKNGVIELTATEENGNIIIAVKDNGIGINHNIQKKLFKEMVTTKGKNGTGLGMYISYAIIKTQFNGNIRFESEPGRGTTFYIDIPISSEV